MTINVTAFQVGGMPKNLLTEDHSTALINHINGIANDQQKVLESFHCLSQILSSEGPYRGICESRLKEGIYTLAKQSPNETKAVLSNSAYKYDPQLEMVIKKVEYLIKGRFFSSYKDWLFWNTKFSHHLSKTLGNLTSTETSRGITYLIAGSTLALVGGLSQLYSKEDDITLSRRIVGLPAMSLGGTFMAAPFLGALQASGKENP